MLDGGICCLQFILECRKRLVHYLQYITARETSPPEGHRDDVSLVMGLYGCAARFFFARSYDISALIFRIRLISGDTIRFSLQENSFGKDRTS